MIAAGATVSALLFLSTASGSLVASRPVRVLLLEARSAVIEDAAGRHEVNASWSLPRLFADTSTSFDSPLRLPVVSLNGRKYRGALLVERSSAQKIRVVNVLDMEEYLRGVVPREVPASWPFESLKAQAVAARSYALHAIELRGEARSWDLDASTADQVYGGYAAEKDTTDRAVEATAGQHLRYGGKTFSAYFSSHCGGHTERASDVWGSREPLGEWQNLNAFVYLACPDTFCSGVPADEWERSFTLAEIRKLSRGLTGLARITGLEIAARTSSGRVETFRFLGTDRSGRKSKQVVGGARVRAAWGPNRLRSLLCDVERRGDRYFFRGKGWGHGVGLCQWGSRGMGAASLSYREILARYYGDATLVGAPRDTAPLTPSPQMAIPQVYYPH